MALLVDEGLAAPILPAAPFTPPAPFEPIPLEDPLPDPPSPPAPALFDVLEEVAAAFADAAEEATSEEACRGARPMGWKWNCELVIQGEGTDWSDLLRQ